VGCGEVRSASRKADGADAGGVDGERDSEKVNCRWLKTPEEVMALWRCWSGRCGWPRRSRRCRHRDEEVFGVALGERLDAKVKVI